MTTPFFKAPLTLRDDLRRDVASLARKYLKRGQVVYDIGCGEKPFKPMIESLGCQYIGVDIVDGFYDAGHIDLVGSAYAVPIKNASADAILSSQVIEHLEFPDQSFAEAARILKPDGIMILGFPFLYPLHAVPHDYLRCTEFFIASRLAFHNFDIVEMRRIGGFWYCAGMLTGYYLQAFDRGVLARLKIIKALTFIVKWLFFLIHTTEGELLKLGKKDPEAMRAQWTMNYTFVARKKA